MRRPSRVVIVVAAAVALLLVGSVVLWRHHERDQEWAHGGDAIEVTAEVRAMDPADYDDTLEEIGRHPEPGLSIAGQMAVVQVAWSGTPGDDGWYEFVLLDDRLSPARPLRAYGAVGPGGERGSDWAGAYQALSEHYPWLAATADRQVQGGWTNDTEALAARAVEEGRATLSFWVDRHDLPTSTPERDLALALFYVDDDGEVRWAKRVPMEPLA